MKKTIISAVLVTALSVWAQPGQIENRVDSKNQKAERNDANYNLEDWLVQANLGDPSLVVVNRLNEELLGGDLDMNRDFDELLQVTLDRESMEFSNFEN